MCSQWFLANHLGKGAKKKKKKTCFSLGRPPTSLSAYPPFLAGKKISFPPSRPSLSLLFFSQKKLKIKHGNFWLVYLAFVKMDRAKAKRRKDMGLPVDKRGPVQYNAWQWHRCLPMSVDKRVLHTMVSHTKRAWCVYLARGTLNWAIAV